MKNEIPVTFSEITNEVQSDRLKAIKIAKQIALEYQENMKAHGEAIQLAEQHLCRCTSMIRASHNLARHLGMNVPFIVVNAKQNFRFNKDSIEIEKSDL